MASGMERWRGRVALVTGASEGIGEALVDRLVSHGMKVVACARNFEKLKQLAEVLNKSNLGEVFPVRCDVSVETEVKEMFKQIEERYGVLHVCVNNAGLAHAAPLLSGCLEDWNAMLGVNVIGLCLCTKEAVALMDKNGIDDGHILHINSMSGHRVAVNPFTHFYAATKHAVTALATGLRNELRAKNSHIRVSCLSPRLVDTEFSNRLYVDDPEKANAIRSSNQENLKPEDMADAIIYVLSAPSRVNVCDIHVKPTEQNF